MRHNNDLLMHVPICILMSVRRNWLILIGKLLRQIFGITLNMLKQFQNRHRFYAM